MTDLKSARVIWIKGILFLILGLLTSALLLLQSPNVTTAILLCISIWAFCRAYYFAFYVIQHYVDPDYRFSGLISFVRYAVRNLWGGSGKGADQSSRGEESGD